MGEFFPLHVFSHMGIVFYPLGAVFCYYHYSLGIQIAPDLADGESLSPSSICLGFMLIMLLVLPSLLMP
jgi:hypothetical protein